MFQFTINFYRYYVIYQNIFPSFHKLLINVDDKQETHTYLPILNWKSLSKQKEN